MKRIVLLATLAAMMAAAMALSGVAQAKPITTTKADKACLVEAVRTVEQPGFNPSDYNFVGGTEGTDGALFSDRAIAGPDVFCGFGGGDIIPVLEAGDIFLGGESRDSVGNNEGTFYGGAGDDDVSSNNEGTFDGGDGTDFLGINRGGTIINVELGDVELP